MSHSLKSSKANTISNLSSNSNSNSNNDHNYIGVDLAKDKLDIFISDTNQFLTISNNKTNINKFIKTHLLSIFNPLADNRIIKSMKGVGDVTTETMIVLLPELGKVNKRQIAALVGVASYNNDSGRKSARRRIKGGRMEIRNVLYMAALSSIRYNPIMKKYYQQLLERQKIKKIAVIAVMRKMLVILNSMMANKTEFVTN